MDFFERHKPVTAIGGFAHAKALSAVGQSDAARRVAQDIWVEHPMGYKVQQAFLKYFSSELNALHAARLTEMLWQDAYASAEAIAPFGPSLIYSHDPLGFVIQLSWRALAIFGLCISAAMFYR